MLNNAHCSTNSSFSDFDLPESLVQVLSDMGIVTPFPIQSATLPDTLQGRDVLGKGKTGSGKTVAFSLPVVTRIARSGSSPQPYHPRGLILVPTRELAAQVMKTLQPLVHALKLKVTTVYGGVSQGPQVKALRAGADIVVACPGRLEDLIDQGFCSLNNVMVTVLDEADHMAELGFIPAVRRILDMTPQGSQRLLFSATLDNGINQISKTYLNNPLKHIIEDKQEVQVSAEHHIFFIKPKDKSAIIRRLAAGPNRCLLFTKTKHGAKALAESLSEDGVPAVDLHGDLSQKVRSKNLSLFSEGRAKVLVATDIAARGIHVDEIALVVHVDPPAEAKSFLHRSGRTARAGASGVVVTLMTANQKREISSLMRATSIKPMTTEVHAAHEIIPSIVGPEQPPEFLTIETTEPAFGKKSRRPWGASRRPAKGRSARPPRKERFSN